MFNQKNFRLLIVLFLSVLLVACKSNQEQQTENQPGEEAAGTGKGQAGKHRAEATTRSVKVPAGTTLSVHLNDAISTGTASEGVTFQASLADPLVAEGVQVAPAGSAVTGKVTHAVSSGRLNRPAELGLTLTSLTPTGGNPIDISTSGWGEKGKSHKTRNIEMIGGGGGVGALIGALAGGKKGAAIGAAVGAGGGTAAAAATGKKEIVLPAESQLEFTLSSPITLTMNK